jgi:serine/threonine protein kinase
VRVCAYCQTSNPPLAPNCVGCGAAIGSAPVFPTNSSLPKFLINGTRLNNGRYVLKGILGHGAFGLMYKAIHKASLEVVAIKEHFPQDICERNPNGHVLAQHLLDGRSTELEYARSLDRFRRENEVLARLRHPSSVKVLEVFEEQGTAYLVMEFLEGQTLEQRLQAGALKPEQALAILTDLLGALEELHGLGFLHRDIKPANIVLTPGRAELVDFGSVTGFDARHDTQVSARLLTPAYAPLEQYASAIRLGPQTDLYALAATMYHALCGCPPENALDRVNGISLEPISNLNPNVSKHLAAVLEDALSLRVDQRPRDARTMLNALGLRSSTRTYGPDSEAW